MNETKDIQELVTEIKELKEKMIKLETDIEDIKFYTPKPKGDIILQTIGLVGGLTLGGLAIYGVFF